MKKEQKGDGTQTPKDPQHTLKSIYDLYMIDSKTSHATLSKFRIILVFWIGLSLTNRIMMTMPIMDAFGNACMPRNDDSSRWLLRALA